MAAETLAILAGGDRVGLPADQVLEVVRPRPLARMPRAPAALLGIANFRGAALPVLSLDRLLDQERGAPSSATRVVVVDHGGPVGLEVGGVIGLAASETAPLLALAPLIARSFAGLGARADLERGRAPQGPAPDGPASVDAGRADRAALVSFDVSGQSYALPLERTREILALPSDLALTPGGDPAVLGVMELRGRLLPLLSARVLLGFGVEAVDRERARVVVVRSGGAVLGLVVDAVRDVLRPAADTIDPPPTVLARGAAEAEVEAIVRVEGGRRLVSVIRADRIVADHGRTAEREDADMSAGDTDQGHVLQFLVFSLGEERYGLPLETVEEVVREPASLARVPRAPAFVRGVMNLRGQPTAVIELAERFERAADRTGRRRLIVVRLGALKVALAVDAASEILAAPADSVAPAPGFVEGERPMFDRVATATDAPPLLVLDPQNLLDAAEHDLLATFHKGRVAAQRRAAQRTGAAERAG